MLVFTKSLAEILGPRASWSFSGGLLWVSPASDFLPTGKLVADYHDDWVPDDVIAGLKEPAKRGDTTITVRGAQNLAPGQYVFLGWKNLPDYSLLAQIAGPPAMNAFPWAEAKELTKQYRIFWPVQIAAVDGARVTLAQPLRLDVRPEWDVSIKPVLPYIEEVGVEHLTVRMESGPPNEHLEDKGFNAVFFSKVIHGWVDDVILENVDNGILLRSTKHVTARDFVIRGDRPHHHGTSAANSFDALFTDFRIESRPRHGISSEWLSSGNVWRRGTLLHGTFDLHSVMPYELIRTNIRVHNDGVRGGGKADGGPLQGARVVHWNIDATGKGELVNQPDVMPSGALVGVRGVPLSRELGPGDVPGDKSCVVADEGLVPSPVDLFEAELELRLKRSPCDVIHCGAVAQ